MDFNFSTELITVTTGDTLTISAVGSVSLPSGTTAQRPTTPVAGMERFNTTLSIQEGYNGTSWVDLTKQGTVTSVAATAPAAGFTIAGSPITVSGTLTFALANDLSAVEGLAGTGFAVRTAADTWANRTLVAGANISLTNADGVAGNTTIALTGTIVNSITLTQPAAGLTLTNSGVTQTGAATSTFALANDLGAIEALNTNAILVRTATDTWAARTLTAPAAGFTITNPAGTAGNPTFVLANDLSAVEGLAGTGFAVRTAADTWTNRTLVAGTGVSITNADGVAGNPTITNTVSATTPGGVNTNVQFNNLGAFGGTSNFNFVSATPRVTITGTGNILFVGDDTVGPAQAGVAKVTIKTDFGVDAEALRIYLNRDLSDNNAWLTFLYDATTDAPLLRLIDEDDDPPAITFDTIDVLGGGTFAAPNISNRFGSRGTIGAVTTGFSWKVNGTEIATMDTQFLEIPGGTTALRPSPASDGMIRFNTSLPAPETFFQADWHPFGAHGGAGYSFLFDDFLSEVSITTSFSTLGWAANLTGTGTALADVNTGINSTDGAFGVIQLATGTTTTGRVGMSLGALNLVFGYGQHIQEWRIQVPTLSTAAEEFLSYVGFTDNYAIAGDVVDGIYFQYDRLTSANWRICTANNSTRTKTTTSTAVTAGTWIKLGIVVNAAGTSVEFFINGVSVGTTTTNIPTAAGRDTGMGCKIEKTAGTTSRTFLVDYFKNHTFFTTAR